MNRKVVFDIAAEADLREIYLYLLPQIGNHAASRYVNTFIDYCETFATFPERGARRDDIRPGLRTVGFRRKATIVFRVEGDVVTVMRIFHRGRDVAFPDDRTKPQAARSYLFTATMKSRGKRSSTRPSAIFG